MTYIAGGDIQAVDYNSFATLVGGMNEIFADIHAGETSMPDASYGYGQLPPLDTVVVNAPVTAAEWAALFQSMRNCGEHQGTTVIPPLPVANPVPLETIVAFNTPPDAIVTLINTLRTNRFNVAPLQSSLIVGSDQIQPGGAIPWSSTLTFTYQIDLGTWDNARHFFNSGGSLNLNASYSPAVTPEDANWVAIFNTMNPLVFSATTTTPGAGINTGTGAGFYGLTTTYQSVYYKVPSGGYYYANSHIEVNAKLNAAAGTNGKIDFTVILVDGDLTPKAGTTVYRIDNRRATGSITYNGPAVIVNNNGFIAT